MDDDLKRRVDVLDNRVGELGELTAVLASHRADDKAAMERMLGQMDEAQKDNHELMLSVKEIATGVGANTKWIEREERRREQSRVIHKTEEAKQRTQDYFMRKHWGKIAAAITGLGAAIAGAIYALADKL